MAATQDEIDVRLKRLERDLRALASALPSSLESRAPRTDGSMSKVSFGSWLQITGPTFATMVLGFSLLWNAQQESHASVLEIQRSVGRLEGTLSSLDARIERLDGRIERLDGRIEGLDSRLAALDTRLQHLGVAVEKLAQRVGPS